MAHIDDPETQRANLRFIRAAMREPLLERDTELDYARRWREEDDQEALHKLIQAYTRLVISTAGRFRNYGLPIGDLVQEGNVGLMQAAARFEPSRGVRFSTYAGWWIRAAMQDFVLRNWSIVRTGTTAAQKSLFFNMRRLRARLEDDAGGPLSQEGRDYIARKLRVPVADVERMEARLGASDQSLDMPIGNDGDATWQDLMADTRPTPEQVVIGLRDARTRTHWLNEALRELSDRERTIIRRRRLREKGDTLEALGKTLGVSKERVRQLEQRAMEKLRDHMERRADRRSDLFADI